MAESESKSGIKPIDELKPGDFVFDPLLLEWQLLTPVPQLLAQFWFTEFFPDTLMNARGMSPNQQPIKEWQVNFGVVVEKVTAYPGHYRPVCLYKGPKIYALYRSKEIFRKK